MNLWFDYPVHKPDTGLLEDLQPDSDYKSLGTRGASKRWGNKDKVSKDKKAELDTAFEACMMDGKVTVYSMAEYMGLKPDTVRRRLKADGGFWIDGADHRPQRTRQRRVNYSLQYFALHIVQKR